MALITRPRRSGYAAERNACFLRGSGLAFCAVRWRKAAHLFSSSAIWRPSSATPIPEIGVRRNSASHVSKATLLLGIMNLSLSQSGVKLLDLSVTHASCQLAGYGYFVYQYSAT